MLILLATVVRVFTMLSLRTLVLPLAGLLAAVAVVNMMPVVPLVLVLMAAVEVV